MVMLTSYEKSFRQFELYCKTKGVEPKVSPKLMTDFLVACKNGYPNNNPKELETVMRKYKGILFTVTKKSLGDLPNMEEMVKLVEGTESQILTIKPKRQMTA